MHNILIFHNCYPPYVSIQTEIRTPGQEHMCVCMTQFIVLLSTLYNTNINNSANNDNARVNDAVVLVAPENGSITEK